MKLLSLWFLSDLTAAETRRLSMFGHIARMLDESDAKQILTVSPLENWRRPVLRGWRLPSRTWNHWTSPSIKQLTWLRIMHSGEWCWCLRMVLRTRGACQKWVNEWMNEWTNIRERRRAWTVAERCGWILHKQGRSDGGGGYVQYESKKTLRFSDMFFSKRLGIFSPNFTRLLHVPIYARLQIFIQLSATLTKLCHIKRDHPVPIICSMSTIGRNARIQVFAKVIDSFVDRCLWQVITDLLQCTFYLWDGLWLWLKFVKCLKHHKPHMVVEWVECRSGEFGGHWSFAHFVVVGYFTHS